MKPRASSHSTLATIALQALTAGFLLEACAASHQPPTSTIRPTFTRVPTHLPSPPPTINAPADPAGTYELVSINGHTLPYIFEDQGGTEILSGTLIVDPVGTFEASMTYSPAPGKPTHGDWRGTYSTSEAALIFAWEGLLEGGGVTPVTVEDDGLTINYFGNFFTYRK